MDWLINNKEWIFSGVGIPVLVGLIGLIRHSGQRKSHEQSRSLEVIPQKIPVSVLIANERISPVTPDDIQTSIESAPPFQQKAVAQRYIGQRIEWNTELCSAEQQGNLVRLQLRAIGSSYPFYVWCNVKFDDYRELAVLPAEAHICINGAITRVSSSNSVNLDNARLTFPSLKNVA